MNLSAVLALNQEHVMETSHLDMGALQTLLAQAFHVGLRNGGADAFLVALNESASYENQNFRWFQLRYRRFVYVDRIIVAAHARGQGLAKSLYAELFALAQASGRRLVACEVNLCPPNPASDAFHLSLGFVEVGRAQLSSDKKVRYLARNLPDDDPCTS